MFEQLKKFVWEYKKLLLVAFFAGVFLPQLYTPSLQASIVNYDDFEEVDEAIIAYHVEVNKRVNEYISTLLSENEPSVIYVSGESDCGSGNVSTYCLAVELDQELLALEQYLVSHLDDVVTSGEAPASDDEDEEEDGGSNDVGDASEIDFSTLEDVIEASSQQKNNILAEMEAAQDTLDLLLAVYNQLQVVYPIHKALKGSDESLTKALEGLNTSLADVRGEIEQFPGKFNDATMVECK